MSPHYQDTLGVLLTFDSHNTLRMWTVTGEQCELVTQLSELPPAKSVYLFMRAKCIVLVLSIGDLLLVTADGNKVPVKGPDSSSLIDTFVSSKGERLLVIGMKNGEAIVKSQQHIMTEEIIATVKPEASDDGGEVTCIKCALIQRDMIMVGTAKGFVMIYDYEKREYVKMYRLDTEKA